MELARAAKPHGLRFTLATMGDLPREAQRREAAEAGNVTLIASSFKLEWMDDPWRDVERAGNWLLNLEKQLKPDVIHLNGYCHGALPWSAPVMVVAHSCVLSWWEAVHHQPAPARFDRYRDNVQAGLQQADLVVAPSAAMLKAAQCHYGPTKNALVIDNARDPTRFSPARRKEEFIFCAGRLWDPAKNAGALNAIAPQLDWPVCLAGSDPRKREDVDPYAVELGTLDADEMAAWLGRASIYALPAKYEPFGLSVLEAACSGCALVLGDIESLRENWDGAAEFVVPDDHGQLLDVLKRLTRDAGARLELAQRGLLRAERFSTSRLAREYLRAYHAILPRRSVPEPAAAASAHCW
jgi:glycosyltransferase involved in cell wall biosynthesis